MVMTILKQNVTRLLCNVHVVCKWRSQSGDIYGFRPFLPGCAINRSHHPPIHTSLSLAPSQFFFSLSLSRQTEEAIRLSRLLGSHSFSSTKTHTRTWHVHIPYMLTNCRRAFNYSQWVALCIWLSWRMWRESAARVLKSSVPFVRKWGFRNVSRRSFNFAVITLASSIQKKKIGI